MPDVVAIVAGDAGADTVASLRRSHPGITILIGGHDVANQAWDERRCHLLIVSGPVDLPADVLGPAVAIVDADPRVATVSFFCDDAGFLSFPRPRAGDTGPRSDLDPDATTHTLRAASLVPASIPYATGPAVLVASKARSAIGPLHETLVDYSLRGRRRGFMAMLDPSTFCRRTAPAPAPIQPAGEPAATLLAEYAALGSALSIVHAAARATVCGLHVLVDAARLGPQEMGTQVATVALIRALARRADVARVCVALAGELPPYAASLRDDAKVDARVVVDRDFTPFGPVDVAHRPFQPDSPADMDACRAVADRVAITVLDLIAYHAVSYQLAPEHWQTYRDWLRQSVTQVDAVVAPSHDLRRQMLLERLPVDDDRLVVAELGTDHLTGDEPVAPPAGVEGPFVVVLGADYTHKNRDLAVRAHAVLCDQGVDLTLVLAGTRVHGSSADLEAEARGPDQRIVELGDVSSEQRNWLLRRAAVVLYPTSGEGFGLVPFEAARFGTPTAFVAFGPLEELTGPLPVLAADWSPAALADAAARLLGDTALARAQVEATLDAGDRYTWDATAAKLVDIYRAVLARPPGAVPRPAVPVGHVEPCATHDPVPQSPATRLATRAADLRRRLGPRLR